jgi:peptidoglycan/LPS O-acetylase OafA/YrhL
MRFRPDINGLRAIAVLSVVFYHYKLPYFSGGYAGVDIFFVISGYLMSVIISTALDNGRFSLVEFFRSRIARIVPALLSMLLIILIFGWLFLEPLTYLTLAKNAIYSLYFFSNFAYYSNGGYFSAPAEQNWFLHTWSLAVEMQFYVAYSVALWAIYRCGLSRAARYIMLGLLAFSLATCVAVTYWRPAAAFYLLVPRAWELLLGGALYSFKARAPLAWQRPAECLGLALIAGACLIFDRHTLWPGLGAVVPTLGAALIIFSDTGDRSLLTWRPLQCLGRWSYSIYLWHWPLWVGLNYFELQRNPAYVALAILVSVGFGGASYSWIEQPGAALFRTKGRRMQHFSAPLAVAGVTVAALMVSISSGMPFRAANRAAIQDSMDARTAWDFPAAKCQGFEPDGHIKTCPFDLGPATKGPVTLVIGDSQAQEWYPRYEHGQVPQSGHPIVFATRAGCPPVPNIERVDPGHSCARFARRAFDLALEGNVERIILIAAWSEYFGTNSGAMAVPVCVDKAGACVSLSDAGALLNAMKAGLQPELERLKSLRKQVILVLPLPTSSFSVPDELAKAAFFSTGQPPFMELKLSDYMWENAQVRSALSSIAAAAGTEVVDPIVFMCEAVGCRLQDERGRSLYKDPVHLRPSTVRQRYSFLDPYIIF